MPQAGLRARRGRLFATAFVIAALGAWVAAAGDDSAARPDEKKDARPALTLRASPKVSFSPTRVFFVAELRGGADDFEEYYCATVEWTWDDGTKSQATYDCEPYEAGKSEIKRRFAVEHVFRRSGSYRVQFKLKRRDKVVGMASTTLQVRPGVREIGHDR